eukprot:NODE_2390_length_555_cov_301.104743_g1898_i0.p1 GENE.NODE_2390_length_555_cov_301.104743_g1898_i0~~NODE_2390_length_555_cov_301.104743_g1898_i0.p1  ORF type:complete len:157 (-),score=59.42 NODE_2390_length_555_cov_301.104743_g1898_i0:83-499(-)
MADQTYTLTVSVTQGNVKKVDPDAYGVTRRDAWTKLVLGDQEQKTTEKQCCLDPVWEEDFTFTVKDPENEKLVCSFFLGEIQLGQNADYNLCSLKKGKSTYKGMAVPGGKIDLQLKAVDFGEEEKEEKEEEEDWMSFV